MTRIIYKKQKYEPEFRFHRYCYDCEQKFNPRGKFSKYCDDCLEKRKILAIKKAMKTWKTQKVRVKPVRKKI